MHFDSKEFSHCDNSQNRFEVLNQRLRKCIRTHIVLWKLTYKSVKTLYLTQKSTLHDHLLLLPHRLVLTKTPNVTCFSLGTIIWITKISVFFTVRVRFCEQQDRFREQQDQYFNLENSEVTFAFPSTTFVHGQVLALKINISSCPSDSNCQVVRIYRLIEGEQFI